jgi:putative transposase
MDTHFCLEMLQEALGINRPGILNSDQGSQFTSQAWISCVEGHGIKVSMDGRGRWADNITIERFWRSLKHEHFLLHSFDSMKEVRHSISEYVILYNHRRLHQGLGYRTPAEVYGRGGGICGKPQFSRPGGFVDNARALPTSSTGPTTSL